MNDALVLSSKIFDCVKLLDTLSAKAHTAQGLALINYGHAACKAEMNAKTPEITQEVIDGWCQCEDFLKHFIEQFDIAVTDRLS